MSYLVLARKLRPQTFDEIIGQQAVVRTLTNALQSGRIHHAFLLCGPRGTGKTSTARILAKALNCEKGPTPTPCNVCSHCVEITSGTAVDVLEIDGASNTGVDDVRQLRENARYLPVSTRRKIYIIDEVHMLSVSAFNALLKTLEEPPEHVTFIFATTEPHKIPVTILSRCQRYDLRRVAPDELVSMLARRLELEGVKIDSLGLEIIATKATGSVRDALSLVDQVISYCGDEEITGEMVREALGLTDRQVLLDLSEAVLSADAEAALRILDRVYQDGQDLVALASGFLGHLRDLSVARAVRDPSALVQASSEDLERIRSQAAPCPPEVLLQLFDRFARTVDEVARSEAPKLVLEMALVGLARAEPLMPLGDLLQRLESLEARLSGGGGAAPPAGGRPPRGGGRDARVPAGRRPSAAGPGAVTSGTTAPRASQRLPPEDPGGRKQPSSPPGGRVVALPADPLEAWGVLVELLERHSRRLAASLYRARLIRLDNSDRGMKVVLGLEKGSFEQQQLGSPEIVREMEEYLSRKLGKPARLLLESSGSGSVSADGAGATRPESAPLSEVSTPGDEVSTPGEGDLQASAASSRETLPEVSAGSPGSLRERDEQWRREEMERKRKEAISHPAVKDIAEILGGSIRDVRVLD